MPLCTILEKWPAPTRPGVHPAELAVGLERVEDGLGDRDVLVGATGHQGVAVLQAPDTAGHPAVDEADALRRRAARVAQVLGPPGVAAVDHEVALAEQVAEGHDGVVGRPTGRHHHPDDLGTTAAGATISSSDATSDDVGVAVVADDRVPGVAEPGAHVAAHLPESDESDLHARPSGVGGSQDSRRRGISR